MKRLLIIGLTLTVLGTTCIPAFATTNTTNTSSIESLSQSSIGTMTTTSYISWLNQKISQSTGSEKSNFSTVLKQFKSLTKEQQAKFINYMNNPQFLKEAISLANNKSKKLSLSDSKLDTNTVVKYNDDITVNSSCTIDTSKNVGSTLVSLDGIAGQIKATYTQSVTFLGINVLQAVIWVRYTTDGEEVTSVDSADAFTGANYFPGLKTDWGDVVTDYNSQKAWATSDLTFSFIYKTSITEYGSCEVGVEGDVDKNVDGWVEEY